MCKIYDERPEFCRVEVARFTRVYEIEEEEFNDFCAFCCREQIAGKGIIFINVVYN